eukprot:4658197-Alexandrium_andersonii.AAC.1
MFGAKKSGLKKPGDVTARIWLKRPEWCLKFCTRFETTPNPARRRSKRNPSRSSRNPNPAGLRAEREGRDRTE